MALCENTRSLEPVYLCKYLSINTHASETPPYLDGFHKAEVLYESPGLFMKYK